MTDESTSIEKRLIRAARRILRPLVRILLRNGVTALTAQELLRKTYVDVAYEEFPPSDNKQTLANVSVLTGLNRKEVARLRKMAKVQDDDTTGRTRAGRVIAGWLTDPEFQSEAGFPLDLSFSGKSPCFVELVKKYSGDMYPSPLREELLRTGAIIEKDGFLRMTSQGYVPAIDEGTKIDILGADTSEFVETIDHNIRSDDGLLLQYKVVAERLPEDRVAAFNEYSRRIAIGAVDHIRRWLIENEGDVKPSSSEPRYIAGVGVYQINRVQREVELEKGDENENRE